MWKLSVEAIKDVDRISLWSTENFGPRQAEEYDQILVDTFDLLSANPELAPERRGAVRRVRLMPCKAHHIVYLIVEDDIVILRVLHQLQDWFDLL
tara:strand:- start:35 stop:319 length:285 start_codon:yes stop_codon:yes gene_type:complete